MPIEITMPALSPTMTEGNLANWLKKEGDKVSPGDVIAEIETDKATMEVEAVDEGVIGKIVVNAGTEGVKVNEVIAVLLEEGEDKAALKDYKPAKPAKEEKKDEEPKKESEKQEDKKPEQAKPAPAPKKSETAISVSKSALAMSKSDGEVKVSPVARRLAEEKGLDLAKVAGTGPYGRIIKADVEEALAMGAVKQVIRYSREYNTVPNDNMRKVIARRLVESKQNVPHFYLTIDCEIDKLLEARQDINDKLAKNSLNKDKPLKVSVNDMVIKAVALSLKDVPEANASWQDDATLRYTNVDVSVAVAIDGGLITPIIKNADQKDIDVISVEMKELAVRAREGKLAPEEFQGGGFSISNLGMFGIKQFNAVINPPQSCILAVGSGEKRAVVKGDNIVSATVMTVTLSCDHRVVDGAVGAKFLEAFKGYIQKPVTLFI